MAFYTFTQNNTGGNFVFDSKEGISRFVIVEARTPQEAIDKALEIGLYFNGVDDGIDCHCCGEYTPTIKFMKKNPEGFIHRADGIKGSFK